MAVTKTQDDRGYIVMLDEMVVGSELDEISSETLYLFTLLREQGADDLSTKLKYIIDMHPYTT